MSVVSHGVISIEDGIKAQEDYAPARKVRVELHFDVPVGAEPEIVLSQVSDMANAHVKRLLRGNVAVVTGQASAPAATPEGQAPAPAPEEPKADVPVTDKELHTAVTRKNDEIKNPKAIRALRDEMTGDPAKTLQQIPVERRREFLDKLARLEKAG